MYGTVDKEHYAVYHGDDEKELEIIANMIYMMLMVEYQTGGEVTWSQE